MLRVHFCFSFFIIKTPRALATFGPFTILMLNKLKNCTLNYYEYAMSLCYVFSLIRQKHNSWVWYCHSHLIKLCTVKKNGTLPKEWISSSLWILKLALWTLNKRLYLSVYDQFLKKNVVRLTTHCHFKISSETKM